jgi:hypothetical protein
MEFSRDPCPSLKRSIACAARSVNGAVVPATPMAADAPRRCGATALLAAVRSRGSPSAKASARRCDVATFECAQATLEISRVAGLAEVAALVVKGHAWPACAQPRGDGMSSACQRTACGAADGDGGERRHGRIVAMLRAGVLHDCDHAGVDASELLHQPAAPESVRPRAAVHRRGLRAAASGCRRSSRKTRRRQTQFELALPLSFQP